ncbi:MAG TPA: hypothetical protein ENI92_03375, partial [Bacteroidetes bacterium]|nr:hypothetical protein [Bacteroidota bacterium]
MMRHARLRTIFPALGLLLALQASAATFYVAPDGTDAPDRGLSEDLPFRSLSYALTVADTTLGRPHEIHLAFGRYTSDAEVFPIPMIDSTSVIGAGPEATILDATGSQAYVIGAVDVDDWSLRSLTVTGGIGLQGGGLLITQGHGALLSDLVLRNNRGDHPVIPDFQGFGGGAALVEAEDVVFDHVTFEANSAFDAGGALWAQNCSPLLRFVTAVHNTCDQDPAASAFVLEGLPGDTLFVESSVIWDNGVPGAEGSVMAGNLGVRYSLVQRDGGQAWPGVGNVWADPLFFDPESDYRVLEGSPVIDLADPSADYSQEPEPNGGRANAGMFGDTPQAQVSEARYELRRGLWAMIGLPVAPPDGDPALLLQDDFDGAMPGEDSWRLQRWSVADSLWLRWNEPEADGLEHGDPPPLAPGRGFVIRQDLETQVVLSVPGGAVDQFAPFVVDLAESDDTLAMQMVANPFPYRLALTNTGLQTPTGEMTYSEAAMAGWANRWVYILEASGRFLPTTGELQPWQGAVLFTSGAAGMQWIARPGREPAETIDPRDDLVWGLYLNTGVLDSAGELAVTDNGHLFGISEDAGYGVDPWDGLFLPDFRDKIITRWTLEDGTPLFHDIRPAEGGAWRM